MPGKSRIRAGAVGDMRQKWPFLGHRVGGRPDMSIFDTDRNPRILVENKFEAGLTGAQPVGYLGQLSEGMSSGLLFIVPERHVDMIWNWLWERVQGARRLLITDWHHVLNALENAVDGEEVRCDVAQFRGLIERLDSEAFQPLRDDQVANAEVPRLVIDFVGLIDSICARLDGRGVAGWGNRGSAGGDYFSTYRRLLLSRDNDDWAYVSFLPAMWRDSGGLTPLWLWANQEFVLSADFNQDGVRHKWGNLFIPIRLQLGVDREQVIEHAVNQVAAMLQGPGKHPD